MSKYFGWAAAGILGIVVLSYVIAGMNAATTPSRVVSKTLQTDNVIGTYESFFNLRAGYDARIAEIKSLKAQLAETPASDRRYAQADLNGVRQTCRNLAQRYNADTEMLNRGTFKANGLPETLDATACEA